MSMTPKNKIARRLAEWLQKGRWPGRSFDDDIQAAVEEIERLDAECEIYYLRTRERMKERD